MTTLYSFALKIETTRAKRVVKFISETRNISDVSILCFSYLFSDKRFQKMPCTKRVIVSVQIPSKI